MHFYLDNKFKEVAWRREFDTPSNWSRVVDEKG
jgi:hypothetical protein